MHARAQFVFYSHCLMQFHQYSSCSSLFRLRYPKRPSGPSSHRAFHSSGKLWVEPELARQRGTLLAAVEIIYSGFPNASVSLSAAVLEPLCTAKWALSWLKLKKEQPLTRRESFACITLFDTGRLDLAAGYF